ncbi:hypothetical protein DFQ26_009815 [Actinomortierella ambigua]|nr:hypothetical protein DFQ26_009815 [Actinomortierella ambigua]
MVVVIPIDTSNPPHRFLTYSSAAPRNHCQARLEIADKLCSVMFLYAKTTVAIVAIIMAIVDVDVVTAIVVGCPAAEGMEAGGAAHDDDDDDDLTGMEGGVPTAADLSPPRTKNVDRTSSSTAAARAVAAGAKVEVSDDVSPGGS